MVRLLKWLVGLSLVAAIGIGGGLAFSVFGPGRNANYTTPEVHALTPSPTPGGERATPSPVTLPAAVILPVPFTSQAPLNDWAAKQHTCEEASLAMVDKYLRGDHSGAQIDPRSANNTINRITTWKVAQDLTDMQLGEMARLHMGWSYEILAAN